MARALQVDSASGPTEEIARILRECLETSAAMADSRRAGEGCEVEPHHKVVLGESPRFGGYVSSMKRLVNRVLCIVSGRRVTRGEEGLGAQKGRDLDPPKMATSMRRMDGFDRSHQPCHYLELLLQMEGRVRPVEVALFNGRLKLSTLNRVHRLLMTLVALATARERIGGFVNPEAAREWTRRDLARHSAGTKAIKIR